MMITLIINTTLGFDDEMELIKELNKAIELAELSYKTEKKKLNSTVIKSIETGISY